VPHQVAINPSSGSGFQQLPLALIEPNGVVCLIEKENENEGYAQTSTLLHQSGGRARSLAAQSTGGRTVHTLRSGNFRFANEFDVSKSNHRHDELGQVHHGTEPVVSSDEPYGLDHRAVPQHGMHRHSARIWAMHD
jgi:hypothetical protein